MTEPEAPHSPVLPLNEAARYVGRTPNALKVMRHRRRGPRGFVHEGRLMYFQADLDAWLAEGAAADPRFNREDPTCKPVEASRPRRTTARKRPATSGSATPKAA